MILELLLLSFRLLLRYQDTLLEELGGHDDGVSIELAVVLDLLNSLVIFYDLCDSSP